MENHKYLHLTLTDQVWQQFCERQHQTSQSLWHLLYQLWPPIYCLCDCHLTRFDWILTFKHYSSISYKSDNLNYKRISSDHYIWMDTWCHSWVWRWRALWWWLIQYDYLPGSSTTAFDSLQLINPEKFLSQSRKKTTQKVRFSFFIHYFCIICQTWKTNSN